MSLKIYTKNNCSQCAHVHGFLDRKNIEYKEFNIEEDEDAMTFVKQGDFMSMPVLVVDSENGQKVSSGRQAALDVLHWYQEGLIA